MSDIMLPDALTPHDPRVTHHYTTIPSTSLTYHYLLANPDSASFPQPTATVLLLHGWPDLSLGWRYQVPFLLSLGLRVIIPDMLGYGRTSAPSSPSEYSLKNLSSHIAHIIREVNPSAEPVLLGTHDWGAFLGWRLAIYYPKLIKGIFAFCIPYSPPLVEGEVTSLEEHVRRHPELGYQLQNARGEVEKAVVDGARSKERLRGWLNAMFGGLTKEGVMAFDPWKGLDVSKLEEVGESPLVSEEIMEFYVEEYSRNGIQGPMNWYRTREINLEDELPLAREYANWQFQVPAMIVMVGHDPALPPELTDGMEKYFAKGLRKEVIPEASHWVLIHTPDEVNKLVGEFLEQFL